MLRSGGFQGAGVDMNLLENEVVMTLTRNVKQLDLLIGGFKLGVVACNEENNG